MRQKPNAWAWQYNITIVLRITKCLVFEMQFQLWALSLFHSNVGTHVCLLDSAQHVPDSEVLGHFGWHHIPGRQQDAGSESSETVSQGRRVGGSWF